MRFFFLFYPVLLLCGCSVNRQSAEIEAVDPTANMVYRVELTHEKKSFLYWSKFQADADTFGMTTHVYNAEGKPDAEAIQAFSEGILEAIAEAFMTAP